MPVALLAELPKLLPSKSRLLGLDIGAKTIGLALSDPGLTVASPIETLRRGKRFADDAKALLALVEGRGVGGLVLGLPINMDGSEGPRAQSVRAFAENLLKRRDLPLAFWDERLSTAAVTRFLVNEADMTRRRRAAVVDKMAAAYILQGALDALRGAAKTGKPEGRKDLEGGL
ncbi:MAG TPA: Holliday junction resolvase RuvX [Alphaproteobacteria bacterium]|nr:Holliday junction resolvase RuvX [Alphaproteobacteria bacterium]